MCKKIKFIVHLVEVFWKDKVLVDKTKNKFYYLASEFILY